MHKSRLIVPVLLVAATACGSDTVGPATSLPAEDLHFLRPALSAPPLASQSVSFYAKRGEDREAALYYRPDSGATDSATFLKLEVPAAALERRPDGTVFAPGDSVRITITVIDPSRLIVSFEPSGLRFSAESPARLSMELGETDDDLNGDGVVDSRDDTARAELSIWRQEVAGGPWYKVSSVMVEDLEELEADINGFTSYAVAF